MQRYQIVVIFLLTVVNIWCKVVSSYSLHSDHNNTTVKLVHILFRHGDRTTDGSWAYPNDPYINETYYPYGFGELTNKGKQRAYMIGKYLRNRYSNFLEDLYTPEVLDTATTDMSRTKMTLELVLAGLYPSKSTELEWDTELNWQPIPYNYVPYIKDRLLTLSAFFCPSYMKHYITYLRSPSGRAIQQKYTELYQYLTPHVGKLINSTFDITVLYFHLTTQQEWGLKLPSWTTNVFPKDMEAATIDQYIVYSGSTNLKQLSGGFLVKEIIKNMQLKVNNKLNPKNRKLFIYSAHEMNVAYVMNALEVYFPHVPPYGAYLLVELHEINGIDGVKIFYHDYSSFEAKPLKIPGCEQFCPLNQFVATLHKNLPADGTDDPCSLSSS